jgi:nitric oxide reductase NorD protein
MSEPEEVILDGAHHATTAIAVLWRRRSGHTERPEVRLAEVRGRLELFTGALFANAPPIRVAEPPAVPNWFARVFRDIPRHMVLRRAVASTDGEQVRLPRALAADDGRAAAFARYRLMATGLAAKSDRGTVAALVDLDDPLVRDLFLLSESVAVERWLVRALPGLASDVREGRRRGLELRPARGALSPLERRVEALVVAALGHPPEHTPADVPDAPDVEASLGWAASRAAAWRVAAGEGDLRYRGLPPVPAWGRVTRPAARARGSSSGGPGGGEEPAFDPNRVRSMVRRPRVRHGPEDEDDQQVGMWMVQIDDPQESVEDPMGLQRPTDLDDDADPADLADSLSELPEARLVLTPGSPREVLASDDPPERLAGVRPEGAPVRVGIAYPEWDWRSEHYLHKHVVVRERDAPLGDPAWVERALARYAREVRSVRKQFERLRPRRIRVGRQADGPDVDLGAYVTAWADRRAGHAVDDRLYEQVLPSRRDISILILVDISGSTDSWVADTRRIVDVEKEALLLVCEALDALGDRYSVLAFSGEGPRGVFVATVKAFEAPYGAPVRSRIAALEPDRFTRVGAAIRHATAALGRESTRHRLLLLLSDGKPNDVDVYEGRYGVEDTRQAVAEARLEGIDAFCLTVDREAPVYLPRIFGPVGYSVLRDAVTLPSVLVDAVRMLLRG